MKIEEAWIYIKGRNPVAREEWGVARGERRRQRAEVIGLPSTLTLRHLVDPLRMQTGPKFPKVFFERCL